MTCLGLAEVASRRVGIRQRLVLVDFRRRKYSIQGLGFAILGFASC